MNRTTLATLVLGCSLASIALTAARDQLKLLYISCGDRDGLINVSQRVHAHLKEHGVPHVWNVDGHGHDRETWGNNLYYFAQRIFR